METAFRHYIGILLCAPRIRDNSFLSRMVARSSLSWLHTLEQHLNDMPNRADVPNLEGHIEKWKTNNLST